MSFSIVEPGEKPMAVGHRGYYYPLHNSVDCRYMEKYPENTEIAFEEALRVGSHGLETGSSE